MASFRKRSERWQARVTRTGHPAQVKTFTCKSDAEKWARSIERRLDLGECVKESADGAIRLGLLIQRYVLEVVPHLRGAPTERVRLKTIQDALGHWLLPALNAQVIAGYRDRRLKQVTPSTVLRELQSLSALLNHARREWSMSLTNPVSSIRKPSANRARSRRLSANEEHDLLAALESNARRENGQWPTGTRNPWIRPLVLLALETAMRRGELLLLRWTNVDLNGRTAILHVTKNGDPRIVPLSTAAVSILSSMPRSLCGRIFPVSADALKHAWQRACKSAGIHDLHFHDLRHEATSRIAAKLPNLIELASVTGHRDVTMLARYYHPHAEELAQKLG